MWKKTAVVFLLFLPLAMAIETGGCTKGDPVVPASFGPWLTAIPLSMTPTPTPTATPILSSPKPTIVVNAPTPTNTPA